MTTFHCRIRSPHWAAVWWRCFNWKWLDCQWSPKTVSIQYFSRFRSPCEDVTNSTKSLHRSTTFFKECVWWVTANKYSTNVMQGTSLDYLLKFSGLFHWGWIYIMLLVNQNHICRMPSPPPPQREWKINMQMKRCAVADLALFLGILKIDFNYNWTPREDVLDPFYYDFTQKGNIALK